MSGNMDNKQRFKSEPPATQLDDASKPQLRRISSEDTERPPSAQQVHGNEDEHDDEIDEEDEEELDSDPAERVIDFDWEDLHERYHKAMQGCHDQEGKLAQEWESLMNYFRIWADSGNDQETDRTFKRLKTRTNYVQNSEDKLEQTRQHYTSVVKAFESALTLLKAHGFGG
ncbi:hypothetical protein CC86DRAFT_366849 [Ophiobolus disseminans]|uniref:Uncharacterized protein n=1 Tax=Ophiobolus disseminans TaxID=1469910 RepID=A0A6A7AFJ7_9PLEO|nr:hypothetical protein CC86DRAFT_366849 [Ophiobolus disseminans]